MNNKLNDIFQAVNKKKYLIISIILFILMFVGFVKNLCHLFNLFHGNSEDLYWSYAVYILICFAIVQMILLLILNKGFNKDKLFVAIIISSFIGTQFAFLILSIKRSIYYIFNRANFLREILIGLLRPGMFWVQPGLYEGNKNIYYHALFDAILFVPIAAIVSTIILWFWLKKDVEKSKAMFNLIFISCIILYSIMSMFMWYLY